MKLTIFLALAVVVGGLSVKQVTSPAATLELVSIQARNDPLPASDDVWNRAQCKGGQFVKVFPMSDADAGKEYVPPQDSAQSRWAGDLKSELATWGWTEEKLPKSVCEFDEFALGKGWVDAAKELGIKTEGWKDIWCYKYSHGTAWNVMAQKKYKVDNQEYPVCFELPNEALVRANMVSS